MIERRKSLRMPAAIKVGYRLDGDAEAPFRETITGNISEGGVVFYVSEPIPFPAILELAIYSTRLQQPIKARARVMRISEIKEKKLYEVGLAFLDMKEKDSRSIRQWVYTVDLDKILQTAVKKEASDIHLVSGQPPIMRVHGELMPIIQKALTPEEIKNIAFNFLTEAQKEQFLKELDLDVSYVNDYGRFRVNIHQEKGQVAIAFRYLPTVIRSVQDLGLPEAISDLARKPNGLILVTGPTGCGKSTTLASMIELINKEKKCIIMSLEEPIEYLYTSKKSVVEQREIGFDSRSYLNALKYCVRQDVDVILIGEVRDLASISIALSAAETGHLVLTTLHTLDAVSSINRIIDVFPPNQQNQIRLQLAETLRGVVSQLLLPRKDKPGRVLATEVLVCTPAVSNLVRKGKLEEIQSLVETCSQLGMHSMDKSLEELYLQRIISQETFLAYASDPTRFKDLHV